ncbi:MAG: CPBP family intramembrane glutamic endopeptidase [Candidatus Pristimantibacillus sp.]
MVHSIERHDWKRFLWAAIAGALIFLFTQAAPVIQPYLSPESNKVVIEKSIAEQKAISFAEQQFGSVIESAHTVYQTDSLTTGYLSKEKLLESYDKQYDSAFPNDTFQVQLNMSDNKSAFVYVHMTNGNIVSWNLMKGSRVKKDQLIDTAQQFAVTKGFRLEELKDYYRNDNGDIVFHPTGYKIGDMSLELTVGVSNVGNQPAITKYKPVFQTPASYVAIVDEQKTIASFLSIISLLYMGFMSLLLAIIYSVLYRRNTTFKRGIVISLIFIVFYIYNNLSVMDGIRAQFGEQVLSDKQMDYTMWFTVLLLIPIGITVYFTLIAGDGMWRSWKRPLWPGFREHGYGDHVWRSMGLSYLFALIILGMQSIIFFILDRAIGAWYTSDATQSPYNMSMLWLLPMMAWCAAISEEAIYRLFGIALFKRWFKNIFVASLIPTLLWALGHVGYPIFPFYTRLIELVILGLVFSYIFLRYGFITAVFTHAILDSLLMGLSLVSVGGTLNITAAIFYAVLPVPIAWVIKFWHDKKGPKPSSIQTTAPPSTPQ